MNILEPLTVMEYTTTPHFRQIEHHTAVAREDGSLIAVTGPAGDADSEAYARLFAAAPDLLDALERLVYMAECNTTPGPATLKQARTAVAKARG